MERLSEERMRVGALTYESMSRALAITSLNLRGALYFVDCQSLPLLEGEDQYAMNYDDIEGVKP